jgi:hypothetical protein
MLDPRDKKKEEVEHPAREEAKSELPDDVDPSSVVSAVNTDESSESSLPDIITITGTVQRAGRWTPDEKILFLYGLKRFGKGRWKKMSIYLPHRYVCVSCKAAHQLDKRLSLLTPQPLFFFQFILDHWYKSKATPKRY